MCKVAPHTAVDSCNAFTEVNLVDGAGSIPAKRAWIRLSVGTERRALTDVDAAQLLAVVWQGTGWCGLGTGDGWQGKGWCGWLPHVVSVCTFHNMSLFVSRLFVCSRVFVYISKSMYDFRTRSCFELKVVF